MDSNPAIDMIELHQQGAPSTPSLSYVSEKETTTGHAGSPAAKDRTKPSPVTEYRSTAGGGSERRPLIMGKIPAPRLPGEGLKGKKLKEKSGNGVEPAAVVEKKKAHKKVADPSKMSLALPSRTAPTKQAVVPIPAAPTTKDMTVNKKNQDAKINPQQALKAAQALLTHYIKVKAEQSKAKRQDLLSTGWDYIHVQIALSKIPQRFSPKPIPIRLPRPIFCEGDDHAICLIVKEDCKATVRKAMQDKQLADVAEVVGLQELRTEYKEYQERRKLRDAFDLFLVDDRIVSLMGKTLGKIFFGKKKQPVPIRLRGLEGHPETVAKRIKAARASTYLYLNHGNCVTLRLARTDFTPEQVAANIVQGVDEAVAKLPGKWKNVMSVQIKTPNSVSLPVYNKLPDYLVKKALSEEEYVDAVLAKEEAQQPKANSKAALKARERELLQQEEDELRALLAELGADGTSDDDDEDDNEEDSEEDSEEEDEVDEFSRPEKQPQLVQKGGAGGKQLQQPKAEQSQEAKGQRAGNEASKKADMKEKEAPVKAVVKGSGVQQQKGEAPASKVVRREASEAEKKHVMGKDTDDDDDEEEEEVDGEMDGSAMEQDGDEDSTEEEDDDDDDHDDELDEEGEAAILRLMRQHGFKGRLEGITEEELEELISKLEDAESTASDDDEEGGDDDDEDEDGESFDDDEFDEDDDGDEEDEDEEDVSPAKPLTGHKAPAKQQQKQPPAQAKAGPPSASSSNKKRPMDSSISSSSSKGEGSSPAKAMKVASGAKRPVAAQGQKGGQVQAQQQQGKGQQQQQQQQQQQGKPAKQQQQQGKPAKQQQQQQGKPAKQQQQQQPQPHGKAGKKKQQQHQQQQQQQQQQQPPEQGKKPQGQSQEQQQQREREEPAKKHRPHAASGQQQPQDHKGNKQAQQEKAKQHKPDQHPKKQQPHHPQQHKQQQENKKQQALKPHQPHSQGQPAKHKAEHKQQPQAASTKSHGQQQHQRHQAGEPKSHKLHNGGGIVLNKQPKKAKLARA